MRAPDRQSYIDLALTPQSEEEFDALELYRGTSGGDAAVARKRREDRQRAQLRQPAA
jgi:hypothetical protein